eukprot:7127328-Karenia_brevis.AAC.1
MAGQITQEEADDFRTAMESDGKPGSSWQAPQVLRPGSGAIVSVGDADDSTLVKRRRNQVAPDLAAYVKEHAFCLEFVDKAAFVRYENYQIPV